MTRIIFLLLLAVPAFAADDREQLLALHEDDRRAHLTGDADLLTAGMADEIRESRDGGVMRVKREELRKMFASYLASVKYSEWKDTAPPEAFISPDGKMAWMLVAVEAALDVKRKDGSTEPRRFVSSWIATYEKQQGKWKMTGIASTVKNLLPKT